MRIIIILFYTLIIITLYLIYIAPQTPYITTPPKEMKCSGELIYTPYTDAYGNNLDHFECIKQEDNR